MAPRPACCGGWLSALASFGVLATSGVGYAVVTYYDGRIGRITIHLPGAGGPSADADGDAVNFLLIGSDTRQGKGNDRYQAKRGSADYVANAHSEVVILMHIPAGSAKATLVSIPRGSYVRIPAYTSGKGVRHRAHKDKFNAASRRPSTSAGTPPAPATAADISCAPQSTSIPRFRSSCGP